MSPEFLRTRLSDVIQIIPKVFRDKRGFFLESYHAETYHAGGVHADFVQDNQSFSLRHVLRGLHYQLRRPQDKLIYVISGTIFDVAVDIRQGSPCFGEWVGVILSDVNQHQLFIPKGFAHGFCVLSRSAHVIYKCSDFYDAGDDYGILWSDPGIGILWPDAHSPVISQKDGQLPLLKDIGKCQLPVFSV